MTDDYIILKACKYSIKALEKMMASARIRIEAMKAENKGNY